MIKKQNIRKYTCVHIDHNVRVSSYTRAVYKKIIAISKETDNRELQKIGQIENKISN